MSGKAAKHGNMHIQLVGEHGTINADLSVGFDYSKAPKIKIHECKAFSGVKINASGFIITSEQAKELGLCTVPGLENHIKSYVNGKDIMGKLRNAMVIDLYGLTIDKLKNKYLLAY